MRQTNGTADELMATQVRQLVLPRLIGGRSTARALASELNDVRGQCIVLNARDLRSASPSSADEFVKVLLEEGGACELRVVSSGPDFLEDLEESARARGVAERLATPLVK